MHSFTKLVVDVLESAEGTPRVFTDAAQQPPFDSLGIHFLEERFASGALRPDMLNVIGNGVRKHVPFLIEERKFQGFPEPEFLNAGRLMRAVRSGCSLLLLHCDLWSPELAEVTNEIRACVAHPVLPGMFLTTGGVKGLAPHVDEFDVFAVQVEGTKAWTVYDRAATTATTGRVSPSNLGTPALEVTLRPGDILYIPRGCAHVAQAPSTSLHLSVGIKPVRVGELLMAVLSQTEDLPAELRETVAYGDALPDSEEQLTQALSALSALLAGRSRRELLSYNRGRDVEYWRPGSIPAADEHI